MDLKDNQTNITFYNGMTTIGGTYIEISYEDSRIIFDFGSEFDPSLSGDEKTLQEILDSKLVPFVSGVFDKNIELLGYEEEENEFKQTAVFLSHLHLDHSKMINFLDLDIPLYTSKYTKELLEVLNFREDFLYKSPNNKIDKTRPMIGLDFGQSIEIGKIKVTLVRVDHDAYGACGLIIETPDKKIAYTGDIRLHGFLENASKNFCSLAKDADVLIIEGVSVSFREFEDKLDEGEFESEKALLDELVKEIESNKNRQILFNYYIANIERILKIKEKISRKVVVSAYNASSIKRVSGIDFYYYKSEGSDEYMLDKEYELDIEDVIKNKDQYLLQLSEDFFERSAYDLSQALYLHLDATPLGDFDPAYRPFIQMFKKRDITFKKLSCSGHAHPKDLLKIIDLIKPKLLVPIHSQKPEKLYNNYGERILPEKKQMI